MKKHQKVLRLKQTASKTLSKALKGATERPPRHRPTPVPTTTTSYFIKSKFSCRKKASKNRIARRKKNV